MARFPFVSIGDHRKNGDNARDVGDWRRAEYFYRKHLTFRRNDFPILIQLGHALKEQGKLGDAETAYRQATALRPDDADAHVQLGHALKLSGRKKDALDAYRLSFRLSPIFFTRLEIEALSQEIGATTPDYRVSALRLSLTTKFVMTELDDMLTFFETHQTFSGIQRVQAEFVNYILLDQEVKDRARFIFVINPPFHGLVWRLDNTRLLDVIRYAMSSNVVHARLRELVSLCRATSTAVLPGKDHFYLALGAFWNFNTVAARFFHLKQANVTVCGFIHDLIPINQPEYCDEPLCHEFELSFADCSRTFDCFMSNSHYTSSSIKEYFDKHAIRQTEIKVVQLAHANKQVDVTKIAPRWTPSIAHLQGKRFVMMVSTIEARKNHAYLIAVWRDFLNNGLEPPDLVLVGRAGWRVSDLMGVLRQSNNFDGRIHLLHDLTDEELNTLYSACLYTAFTSYVEGWGLPVGESLAHGKTCVASNASAVPEIAGDLIDYIDPLNIREGVEVFRKMTFDDAYREARTAQMKNGLTLRTWTDFSRDLVRAIDQVTSTPRIAVPVPHLAAAVLFRPEDIAYGRTLDPDYFKNPLRLMMARSWRPLESWGCWMHGEESELRFATDSAAGTELAVYLELRGSANNSPDQAVEVTVGDRSGEAGTDRAVAIQLDTDGTAMLRVFGKCGPDGVASVVLRISRPPPGEAPTKAQGPYMVGLCGLGYAPTLDADARIALGDAIIFQHQAKMPAPFSPRDAG